VNPRAAAARLRAFPLIEIGRSDGSFQHLRLPSHCVPPRRLPGAALHEVEGSLRMDGLRSVCEEARCPNRGECWSRRAVTFMLLGDVCTRACRFCAVRSGRPPAGPDPLEPQRVARAAARLGLAHVVLTSVNRDDLVDGGALHFAHTVRALRAVRRETTVEVLTPDFRGQLDSVHRVCDAEPDVYNHNVETVPRLYARVRPGARFERSLRVLAEAKRQRPEGLVKSGLMVGLGECFDEVGEALRALREVGVDTVTVGQYLRPTRHHLPVERYWQPEEFEALAEAGRGLGFLHVACAPLVRSSYNADETLRAARTRRAAERNGAEASAA
jgi:lipoic acid synthetase